MRNTRIGILIKSPAVAVKADRTAYSVRQRIARPTDRCL